MLESPVCHRFCKHAGTVRRFILGAAILLGAQHAESAAASFGIDSFDIDVGQDHVVDVAVFEDGSRAIVMFSDGPIRLLMINVDKRAVVDPPEGVFDGQILADAGAILGRDLYISCSYGLFLMDLETKERTPLYAPSSWAGGSSSAPVVVSAARTRLFSITANELVAVDTASRSVVAHASVPVERTYALAMSRDDREVYVADGRKGILSRFDAADLSPLGSSSFVDDAGNENRVPGLAVAPGGSIYIGYTSLSEKFTVAILSNTGAPVTRKVVEWGTEGLAMTPDGAYLITGYGDVVVRKTLELLGRVRTNVNGGIPHVTHDGRRALVAHGGGGRVVHVIDLTSIPRVVSVKVRPAGIQIHAEKKDEEVIPVAILSAPGFDPRSIQPRSICFGNAQDETRRSCGSARVIRSNVDLNGDGENDLVLGFLESSAGINVGDPEACLTGKTTSGGRIAGCDTLSWVPRAADPP